MMIGRSGRRLAIGALLLLALVAPERVQRAAAGAPWIALGAGSTGYLYNIACPNPATCFAVGFSGTILATTDGGATWNRQRSATTDLITGINCPTVTTCFAVHLSDTVLVTTDGGKTWARRSSGTEGGLIALDCPSPTTCFAVGFAGTITATTDGGKTWTPRSPLTRMISPAQLSERHHVLHCDRPGAHLRGDPGHD